MSEYTGELNERQSKDVRMAIANCTYKADGKLVGRSATWYKGERGIWMAYVEDSLIRDTHQVHGKSWAEVYETVTGHKWTWEEGEWYKALHTELRHPDCPIEKWPTIEQMMETM